jgi:iron complex transport system ATP-binding protein
MSAVFTADSLTFRYPDSHRDALADVTASVDAGAFACLIGPNGCGKSTLLRLLLGALKPASGSARFEGRASSEWDRRELALMIGAVAQIEEVVFPFTVWETVSMGRYPHLGAWRAMRDIDREAVTRALARCDLTTMSDRLVSNLSGGERQRVRIARALAQQPRVLVLDEPTASLDLGHEMALFELLDDLCTRDGVTVVAATHNLNLAARFASAMLLLVDGRVAAAGTPARVITKDVIERVYGWAVKIDYIVDARGHAPQVIPLRSPG